jgi:hypothetical protein
MNEEERNKVNRLLDGIQRRDFDRYMEMCYESITRYPEQIVDFEDVSLEQKQAAMDRIIKHFAERDMFERCQELKLVKEKLK